MNRFISKITNLSFYIWFFGWLWGISIVVFVVTLLVSTNLFRGMVDSTNFGNSDYFIALFFGSIGVGGISFLLMALAIITKSFLKKNIREKKGKQVHELKKTSQALTKSTWLGVFILLGIIGFLNYKQERLIADQKKEIYKVITTPSPVPVPTLASPTVKPKQVYTDSDPIIICTISSNCGGGTRQMKQSECSKSTCCQIGNNWSLYPSKESCIQAQNNAYPPCTIYYAYLGYSRTYNLTPSDCSYYQQSASTRTQPLNLPSFKLDPLPSVAPYQPSKEYLDSINNFNNVVNATWAPTQVVLPTPRCYANWDEYFNAHPEIAGSNVAINNGTPPCD